MSAQQVSKIDSPPATAPQRRQVCWNSPEFAGIASSLNRLQTSPSKPLEAVTHKTPNVQTFILLCLIVFFFKSECVLQRPLRGEDSHFNAMGKKGLDDRRMEARCAHPGAPSSEVPPCGG